MVGVVVVAPLTHSLEGWVMEALVEMAGLLSGGRKYRGSLTNKIIFKDGKNPYI
jgi:hypothetical protein